MKTTIGSFKAVMFIVCCTTELVSSASSARAVSGVLGAVRHGVSTSGNMIFNFMPRTKTPRGKNPTSQYEAPVLPTKISPAAQEKVSETIVMPAVAVQVPVVTTHARHPRHMTAQAFLSQIVRFKEVQNPGERIRNAYLRQMASPKPKKVNKEQHSAHAGSQTAQSGNNSRTAFLVGLAGGTIATAFAAYAAHETFCNNPTTNNGNVVARDCNALTFNNTEYRRGLLLGNRTMIPERTIDGYAWYENSPAVSKFSAVENVQENSATDPNPNSTIKQIEAQKALPQSTAAQPVVQNNVPENQKSSLTFNNGLTFGATAMLCVIYGCLRLSS